MPKPEERESPTTDPNFEATLSSLPLASVEKTTSAVRPIEAQSQPPASDTLLSAPQVTREDLAFDDRLVACERELQKLMLRVEQLEQRPDESSVVPKVRWFWLVFLAGLAVAWQILTRLH